MNIPGFTAEASLYKSDVHYRAVAKAHVQDRHVLPAAFSDRIDPDRPFISVVPPGWGNCLTRSCWLKLHGGGPNEYTWVEEVCTKWKPGIC